jgi:hypothetical protein
MGLRAIAAILLILGIALGVMVTFFGVERRRGDQIKRPHPALNLPAIAAAAASWGLIASILTRAGVRTGWTLLAASIGAALAWIGMGALLAKWALRAPLEDPHELAEMLQGHVAVVTEGIGEGDGYGRITYQLQEQTHVVRARSLDGQPISEGTEVVIERIDGDVAYVEPWSLVEKRI